MTKDAAACSDELGHMFDHVGTMRHMPGDLYYGDNLDVMRRHIATESVDLVYLDPPFNSDRTYNLIYQGSQAQERAFVDTWTWDDNAESAFRELTDHVPQGVDVPQSLRDMMRSLKVFLDKHRDMLAYISMMAIRLVEMRRVLRKSGSIYVHCDSTASHYLKLILDGLFGADNFRREIIWRSGWVSGFKTKTPNWIRNHDTLFYYLRDQKAGFTFNKDLAYKPHAKGYKRRGGGGNPKGVAIDDVWDELKLYSPWIKSFSTEKLGYMTQKPLALLDRIISVSSNPGDLVLDPFCGCGTTVESAQSLGRKWIGIDVAIRAMDVIKGRRQQVRCASSARAWRAIGCRPGGPALQSPTRTTFNGGRSGRLVGAHPEVRRRRVATAASTEKSRYETTAVRRVVDLSRSRAAGH